MGAAIIAFLAVFSIVSWATLSVTSHVVKKKQLNELFSNNEMMTGNYTTINLSELGQSVSVRIAFNTALAPWHLNDAIYGSLDVAKAHQNISFPFTDLEITISSIIVYANGINLAFHLKDFSIENFLNGTRVVTYYGSFYNVPGLSSVNLTVTGLAQIILISGIYHFPGEKKLITSRVAVP